MGMELVERVGVGGRGRDKGRGWQGDGGSGGRLRKGGEGREEGKALVARWLMPEEKGRRASDGMRLVRKLWNSNKATKERWVNGCMQGRAGTVGKVGLGQKSVCLREGWAIKKWRPRGIPCAGTP